MMEPIEFNARLVLEILIQKSSTDKTLAAQIEAAIWQSKYESSQEETEPQSFESSP